MRLAAYGQILEAAVHQNRQRCVAANFPGWNAIQEKMSQVGKFLNFCEENMLQTRKTIENCRKTYSQNQNA